MTVEAKKIHDNPSAQELRAFTEEMPNTRLTEFENVNVQTRVTSRSAGSTSRPMMCGSDGCGPGAPSSIHCRRSRYGAEPTSKRRPPPWAMERVGFRRTRLRSG